MQKSGHAATEGGRAPREQVAEVRSLTEAVQTYAVRLVRREMFRELCGDGHMCFLEEEKLVARSVSEIREAYLTGRAGVPFLCLHVALRKTVRSVILRDYPCDRETMEVVWSRLAWPDLSFIAD